MAIKKEAEKFLQGNTGFTIDLIIGEYSYESDLRDMRIVSVFKSAYPMFVFNLNIKPIEMIQHNLLGGNLINLVIHLKNPEGIEMTDPFSVDLLYLSGEYDIPISNTLIGADNEQALQDQRAFTIKAVPEAAYRVMTWNINRIYRNKSPYFAAFDMTSDIIKKIETANTTVNLKMDSKGINDTSVDQLILPPTVFKNHCDYLLNEFGIYDGFGILFSSVGLTNDYDGSYTIDCKFKNITERWLNADTIFKIIHLANDEKDTDKITNNFESGKFNDYYIYTDINTNYVANSTFSKIGIDNYYIHKPIDKFYRIDNITLDDYISNIYDGAMDIEPHLADSISNRKRYMANHISYNRDVDNFPQKQVMDGWTDPIQDEYWLSSSLNKYTFNMSRIRLTIEREFPLHVFTNIGDPILFESRTNEYEKLNGKYILFSSDIKFKRDQGGWKTIADLTITRPTWSNFQNV